LSASKQPANTVKPRPLRCFARARPKPVSHPVTRTDLSPTSSWSEDWSTARLAAPGARMASHEARERLVRESREARQRLEVRASASLW